MSLLPPLNANVVAAYFVAALHRTTRQSNAGRGQSQRAARVSLQVIDRRRRGVHVICLSMACVRPLAGSGPQGAQHAARLPRAVFRSETRRQRIVEEIKSPHDCQSHSEHALRLLFASMVTCLSNGV